MDTILIAGVDSVVGAALAGALAGADRVVGTARRSAGLSAIGGCELAAAAGDDERSVRQLFATLAPCWTIYCGPGAESCWNEPPRAARDHDAVQAAGTWARAARDAGSEFTCISSDAVFTGPRMFHDESSRGLCGSLHAQHLRAIEAAVLQDHPAALVVRTHVFGWTPEECGAGWIERILNALEDGTARPFDAIRHATPILAADFADVLLKTREAFLSGVYHIAGAERTSPARFVGRLAQEFGLDAPACGPPASLLERPCAFGCGETSLRTTKIRTALGVSLPTLADGLRRLREEHDNGDRECLPAAPVELHELAA
ncbi:MAG TPA: sugar nucleotide-binding protein [Planctomycetaceae bacterium]|nr:sugar nucleotide-binding protein [Planctomycetaceae bacterium]